MISKEVGAKGCKRDKQNRSCCRHDVILNQERGNRSACEVKKQQRKEQRGVGRDADTGDRR